jgi:hypothetical protein
MKTLTLRTAGLVAALLLPVVLPIAASDQAALGRQVQPSDELAAFFKARGVDPQYPGKPKSVVPAEQWKLIQRIANTPDHDDPDTDYVDYYDDHDVLNPHVLAECGLEGSDARALHQQAARQHLVDGLKVVFLDRRDRQAEHCISCL